MRRLATAARVAALALLGLLLIWALDRLEWVPPAEVASTKDASEPRYQMRNIQITRLDDGGLPQLRIEAASIEYFDDQSARLQVLTLSAPGTDAPVWRAESPTGHVPAGETRLVLDGPVQGSGQWPNGEPLRFSTPTLSLDWNEHELYSDAGVYLDSRSRKVRADTLRSNWTDRSLRLSGDVRIDYASP